MNGKDQGLHHGMLDYTAGPEYRPVMAVDQIDISYFIPYFHRFFNQKIIQMEYVVNKIVGRNRNKCGSDNINPVNRFPGRKLTISPADNINLVSLFNQGFT